MEGDMKDIVLSRLESRLKDKDEEIHALKERVIQSESADQETVKMLAERLDKVEVDVHELQITISEVMKKVGALESTMDSLLMSVNTGSEEPSEVPTDMSMPGGPQLGSGDFGDFAASLPDQKDIVEDGHSKGDSNEPEDKNVLRFFQQSKNS
jgi:hypothetical protein